MASVASARPIGLRRKPSPPHAKWPQIPLCASFRSHLRRTITAPHRPRPASIPIAPAAPPAISSRDFVPWRFSDAGRTHARLDLHSGVRETCTKAEVVAGGSRARCAPESDARTVRSRVAARTLPQCVGAGPANLRATRARGRARPSVRRCACGRRTPASSPCSPARR